MHQLDKLTTYDSDAIGREFTAVAVAGLEERRRIESRRNALLVQEWKESFGDSRRLPKSALQNTCTFEKYQLFSESLMTWAVTIFLSALAGIICAVVIRQLNL